MRVRIGVLLLGLVLVSLGAPAAGADPVGATVVLRPAVGPPASTVTAKASGFTPRERIHVSFDGTVEVSALANASGGLKRSFAVPASALPGTHDVNATGLISGLTADTSFLVQTDWPQFGDTPDHQSDDTAENVLSVKNAAQLAVDWTQPGGAADNALACPVVAGGLVYLGGWDDNDEPTLEAIDAATGTVDWALDHQEVGGCPAVYNGIVYAAYRPQGGPSTVLEAVRARSGAPVWSKTISTVSTGAVIGSPTVSDGVVYVVTQSLTVGGITALRASDGATLWTYTGGTENVLSPPAVADGAVYVSAQDGDVLALGAVSGQPLWSYPTGADRYPAYSPVVANGVVYVDPPSSATARATVYALDDQTGALIWSYLEPLPSSPISGLAIGDGLVIAGYAKNHFVMTMALDAATGAFKWAKNIGDRLQPSIANGVLYTAGAARLRALKLSTGKTLWSYDIGNDTPAIANGVVYASTLTASGLYAFHLPQP